MRKIDILKLFTIDFLFTIFVILMGKFYEIEIPNPYEKQFQDYKIFMYLIIGIIAPIMEEFMFRYHLIKTKFTYIILVLSSFLFFVIQDNYFIIALFLILNIVSFYIYFSLQKERLPLLLVFFYAIYFAILHCDSYDVLFFETHPFYTGILCFQFLLFSSFISYIRLNAKNFFWVLMYHILYNCLGLVYYEITT